MKQRKLCGRYISSSSECNGHVKSFTKRTNKDECQCTNGNRLRNSKNPIDKTKGENVYESQTKLNRSQRCLNNDTIVQIKFNSVPISCKFAFHQMILLIVILVFDVCCVVANGQQNPDIFSIHKTHYVIQPTIFDERNQREVLASTRQTTGEHIPRIILEYTHLDKTIVADLFLNQHLLPAQHFLRSQNPNGQQNVQTFNKSNSDLCHYQGKIRNKPTSKVVLSTCDGIGGLIFDGEQTYFIHSNDSEVGALHKPHYIFSQNQMDEQHPMVRNSVYAEPNPMPVIHKSKTKRSVTEFPAQEPYNANKQSSYVELLIVVDNDVYKEMGENLDKVHKYCKDIANIINSLYVPLNIFVALVGVIVWTEKNEIELSSDGDKTLKNFLIYRRKTLVKDHPNDNAQLLTKVQFDGGVVGKALKGPICTYEFSGGVSTYHSAIVSVVATTIAHEMGHNFGMEHDTADCKCNDERCIMSASSSSVAPTHWSECSIHQLNLALHHGMNYCLKNIPQSLFDPPTCGNDFVEAGEECDCGLPNVCKNTCCDPNTCKLRSNATCATGKCCDLATCQPHEPGFECRSSAGECDLPEYCDGNTEYCPSDYFKRDTELCGGGKAFCFKGTCKSHDDQCKLLWGPSGKSSEQCYEKNLDGTRHGNCGYNPLVSRYKNCTKEDIYCGMLQCRHLNERLEFGLESVAVLSHSFITNRGAIIPCRTAVIDLGLDTVDPGLAPDGSKCGEEKMCVNQKCVSIDVFRKEVQVKECQNECNQHGTCDNIGHCHCDKGFAPPLCDSPGPGGSIHSGPASNPYDGYGFARVLYVFFLGVVPFISLSLFLLYYWRQNLPWFISKSANDLKISVRHYPDRPAPPPPTSPLTQLSPSSTDDMNATLLKSTNTPEDPIKRELFGNFKGFSLKPLPMTKPSIVGASNVAYVHPVAKSETTNDQCLPSRAAPLPPNPNSPKKSQTKSSPKLSPSSFRYQNINTTEKDSPETPIEVKLFATKSDAKERPKISHPVLENSTCSVKELIAAAKFAQIPQTSTNPLPKNNQPSNVTQKPNSFSSNAEKAPTGKSPLKKLEISAPMKTVTFGRSQSMRSPSTEKSFTPPKRGVLASGSMRYPGGTKRVNSFDRPKNPPPPRPSNLPGSSVLLKNIYANSNDESHDNSTDNIYCVIEDIKESSPPNGLLSEIVNEIENRNVNSIYSTSKNQKKNPTTNDVKEQTTYQNIGQKNNVGTKDKVGMPPLPGANIQKSDNTNNVYMNTTSGPPRNQSLASASNSNVSAIAKKLSANLAVGNAPKPVVAQKPKIPSIAEQKNSSSLNKQTSQSDSVKKPFARPTFANATKQNASSKATINPTSSVRSMHKRFENRNT